MQSMPDVFPSQAGLAKVTLQLQPCCHTVCRKRAEAKSRPPNFDLLDAGGGAGWDLVCRLMTERNRLQRGRLSVGQALQHKFLR